MRDTKYKIYYIKYVAAGVITLLLLVTAHSLARASSISATPVVIDLKAAPRDIIKETVTVYNGAPYKANIYVFVNNVVPEGGVQEFVHYQESDKTTSLANWIEISRGVIELGPGEAGTLEFRIEAHPEARAGIRHAAITFAEGSTRAEAEEIVKRGGGATIAVNLEVKETIRERMQIKKFAPDRILFTRFPISFSYEVENIGNREQILHGSIRIYNRRGEEVAEIAANEGGAVLNPDSQELLASAWESARGNLFGRYKAVLRIEYGSLGVALQDTVFFWIVPWQLALGISGTLIALVVALAFLIHRMYEKRYAFIHAYHAQREGERGRPQAPLAQARAQDSLTVVAEQRKSRMTDIHRK